ncbi:hypothetical protein [Dyadobacter psychrotolerans]|uniref:DUF1440 domain-containing protein n=1 Tax=Dyadobacter psychrotolerans TaxID=2541721 RepID=A0A4R5DSV8_9BACT|nr:hypothetical protein [Dyadobacter psychrotolerans]TDE15360.1 hypothetical protein E0F88_12660 [Dyadobacter psychrotolerans]
MKEITNLAGGLAGALALNILHETVRRFDSEAPRIDLVGEEALTDIIESTGADAPKGNTLYAATLAGDLISNALYYSAIGLGNEKDILWRGAGYGLMAGAGAVFLTKPLGLNEAPVAKTTKTKVLTATWYLFGGLVAALAIRGLKTVER